MVLDKAHQLLEVRTDDCGTMSLQELNSNHVWLCKFCMKYITDYDVLLLLKKDTLQNIQQLHNLGYVWKPEHVYTVILYDSVGVLVFFFSNNVFTIRNSDVKHAITSNAINVLSFFYAQFPEAELFHQSNVDMAIAAGHEFALVFLLNQFPFDVEPSTWVYLADKKKWKIIYTLLRSKFIQFSDDLFKLCFEQQDEYMLNLICLKNRLPGRDQISVSWLFFDLLSCLSRHGFPFQLEDCVDLVSQKNTGYVMNHCKVRDFFERHGDPTRLLFEIIQHDRGDIMLSCWEFLNAGVQHLRSAIMGKHRNVVEEMFDRGLDIEDGEKNEFLLKFDDENETQMFFCIAKRCKQVNDELWAKASHYSMLALLNLNHNPKTIHVNPENVHILLTYQCQSCNLISVRKCSQCKTIHYCSLECEANDIARHEHFCRVLKLEQTI